MPDTPEKPDAAKPASEAKTETLNTEQAPPAGATPKPPVDSAPRRWTPAESVPATPAGTPGPPSGTPATPYQTPRPKRTSAEIRADIDAQREQLGQNVDHLRDRVTELTDWRSQLRRHRKKVVVGAVATGFVVGGLMALRRR